MPATAPVMPDSPLRDRVTVESKNPDPAMSIVCDPVLAAPPGDMPVICGAADDGCAVAMNVTGVRAPLDATRELVPGDGPRVHRVTVATPFAFVAIAVEGRTVPPPIDTVKRTARPRT